MKKTIIISSSIIFSLLVSCVNSDTSAASKEKTASTIVPVSVDVPALVKKPEDKDSEILSTHYGVASWYSVKTNHGTKTASGRRLNDSAYTAAHKTLPFGSQIRVTNLSNGRSEKLTINDRGPYVKGRIVDVTIGSSKRLGFYSNGKAKIKVQVLNRGNWKYQH